MQTTKRIPLLLCVIVTAFLLGTWAHSADEKKAVEKKSEQGESEREVEKSGVPAAALKTLEAQAAGAQITEFAEEIEHGHKFYEGSFKSATGSKTDVLVTEAGDLVEIEESVAVDTVPATVQAAARKAAGENATMRFEKKTAIVYEIHFRKSGRGQEIVFTPDGRIVEEEGSQGAQSKDDDEKDEK